MPTRIKRTIGDVVEIPLGDETYGLGVVLAEPLMAFYDLRLKQNDVVKLDASTPIAFAIWVMNYAITKEVWRVVSRLSPEEIPRLDPVFYKQDSISKKLSLYKNGHDGETPCTLADIHGLEAAAVWDPMHVVDRLQDHFNGTPNKWVESMRPKS